MTTNLYLRQLLAGSIVLGVLGTWGASALARETPAKEKGPATPAVKMQTFEVTHANPDECRRAILQLAPGLLGGSPAEASKGPQTSSTGTPAAVTGLSIAMDGPGHTLFVRGREPVLAVVGKLIADLEADPALAKKVVATPALRVHPLHGLPTSDVLPVLTSLGLQGSVLMLPKSDAVVLLQPDGAECKDVCTVIQRMEAARQKKEPLSTKPNPVAAPKKEPAPAKSGPVATNVPAPKKEPAPTPPAPKKETTPAAKTETGPKKEPAAAPKKETAPAKSTSGPAAAPKKETAPAKPATPPAPGKSAPAPAPAAAPQKS